ncbi:MAG: ATP-binding protein [Paracoccaceae bacterium]
MNSNSSHNSDFQTDFEETLYHITHDLRAAFRAVKALSEWTREDLTKECGSISPSVSENLDLLEARAIRADQMMLDLRTYSRVGRQSAKPSTVYLKAIVARAAEALDLNSKIEIHVNLGVHAIVAPANDCALLFETIFSNTVKHHDRDSGTIIVTSKMVDDRVRITIEDDGPGIPIQDRERAFALMQTLLPRDECEGSGLGLSIARKIVGRLDGSIEINGPDGERGTLIDISLPAKIAAMADTD